MTEQEINIAIAEWCGWTTKTRKNCYEGSYDVWLKDGKPSSAPPPDYCHDLNAIHEAVGNLPCTDPETRTSYWSRYINQLNLITRADEQTGSRAVLVATEATARQRAEALLRTIGKWKEAV